MGKSFTIKKNSLLKITKKLFSVGRKLSNPKPHGSTSLNLEYLCRYKKTYS